MRKLTCYLAGPMRNYPNYNFPAFYAAEAQLELRGHRVTNPARMDIDAGEAVWTWTGENSGLIELTGEFSFAKAMRRDIRAISHCDALVLLPGWEGSVGAQRELEAARLFDIEVYQYDGDGCVTLLEPERGGTWDASPSASTPA